MLGAASAPGHPEKVFSTLQNQVLGTLQKFWVLGTLQFFFFCTLQNQFLNTLQKMGFENTLQNQFLNALQKAGFWVPFKGPSFCGAQHQHLTKSSGLSVPYKSAKIHDALQTSFAIPYKNQVPPSLTKPEFPMPYKKEVFNSLQKKPASYLPKILTACGLEFL